MQSILDAVDLSTVSTWLLATGLVIIAITMAFKGIDLGKRAVKKA